MGSRATASVAPASVAIVSRARRLLLPRGADRPTCTTLTMALLRLTMASLTMTQLLINERLLLLCAAVRQSAAYGELRLGDASHKH